MVMGFYKDVVPFVAMVAVEVAVVGSTTVYKTAVLKGLSIYAYLVCGYSLGAIILLPFAFILRGKTKLPSSKFPIIWRLCVCVLVGTLAHICGNIGVKLSSPTLDSAAGSLRPAFTFILAVIFRMERINLSSSSLYKMVGTIVSISGALVVILFKGPTISSIVSPKHTVFLWWLLQSSQSDWVLGGFLLTVQTLLYTIWSIFMTEIMLVYPAEIVVAFFYNLGIGIASWTIYFIADHDINHWSLGPDRLLSMAAISCSAVFTAICSTVIHSWGYHLKGPLYISMFTPLSIAIAAIMSSLFLRDALHLGCVVGAMIITVGFYTVIWGKAKEEMVDDHIGSKDSDKMPLLLHGHEDLSVDKP